MRTSFRLIFYPFLAIILWLLDSLIVALTNHVTFQLALWSGVSGTHLLFRLLAMLVMLMIGVLGYLAEAVRRRETVRINKADDGRLFGDARSNAKSRRLLYHSMRLATVFRMLPRDKEALRQLCYCYDIGIVGLSDQALTRTGSLTTEEQKERDKHLDLGAAIAANIPELRRAAPLIACHEENYDGSGPRALVGRGIPLACRIFVIALLYDYYTQPSETAPGLDKNAVLDEMTLYSGTMLDPEVLTAFRKLLQDRRFARRITEHVYAAR